MICLLLLLAFGLWGCAPIETIPEPEKEPDALRISRRAEQAWQEGRLQETLDLYQELLQLPDPAHKLQEQAWQRIAQAALETGQYGQAGRALQHWSELNPEVRKGWPWNSLLADYFELQGRYADLQQHLNRLLEDGIYALQVQLAALFRLSRHYIEQGKYAQAWSAWQDVYSQQKRAQDRLQLENALLDLLQEIQKEQWFAMQEEILRRPRSDFPGALLQWAFYVQGLHAEHFSWPRVWPILQDILSKSQLEMASKLEAQLQALSEKYGPAKPALAMLLPLDGDFRKISRSLLRGADTALWQMPGGGTSGLEVRVINTSSAAWRQELEDLPMRFQIVGGPLQSEVWQEISRSGCAEKRIFFTFRPELPQGDEGQLGYRFFPGHKDQVQSMLQVLQSELDIDNYAVLYPKGEYGRRMSKIFWEEAQRHQGRVSTLASYPARDHTRWKGTVADFLQVPQGLRGPGKDAEQKKPGPVSPLSPFRAVYLPDSLAQARTMIPEFFYYDARSLIFIGPLLWSQERQDIDRLDQDLFRLALMPGAWLLDADNPAVQSLIQGLEELLQGEPDFWTALGYDFLRFAQELILSANLQSPSTLNEYLAGPKDFAWSMAPLVWDEQGRARQELFLLQPGDSGPEQLDLPLFKARWALEREYELRRRARYIDLEVLQ